MHLAHLILSILLPVVAAQLACNGHTEFCSRRYSDVTMIGAHNSPFVGISPFHNQYVSLTRQLDLGVRFVTAQTQNKDGAVQLCHTTCLGLDVGPLEGYLAEMKSWMDQNPNEVVTLLLTNVDALEIEKFDSAFRQTGLIDYVFRPGKALSLAEWPTLGELVTSRTRVIVFMGDHSDTSKVDYILDEFQYFWETPFGITDRTFPQCNIDRPQGTDGSNLMYLINHVLNTELFFGIKIPNQIEASWTNSFRSIDAEVSLCRGKHGRKPNVVLLDWVGIGQPFDVLSLINGV